VHGALVKYILGIYAVTYVPKYLLYDTNITYACNNVPCTIQFFILKFVLVSSHIIV